MPAILAKAAAGLVPARRSLPGRRSCLFPAAKENPALAAAGWSSSLSGLGSAPGAGACWLSLIPNVFESIGPGPITNLEPKSTTWYVSLASSLIVVAYNPASKCAVRGDRRGHGADGGPVQDRGDGWVQAGPHGPGHRPAGLGVLRDGPAARYHLPAGTAAKVLGPLNNPKQAYQETSLESYLQTGQVDATSSYRSSTIQLGLHYITLPDALNFGEPSLASTYAKYTIKLDDGQTVHGVPTAVYAAPHRHDRRRGRGRLHRPPAPPVDPRPAPEGQLHPRHPQVYGTGARRRSSARSAATTDANGIGHRSVVPDSAGPAVPVPALGRRK